MNKNNIAILILIVGVVAGISYFIGDALFGNKALKPVDVPTATLIEPGVVKPEPSVFAKDAINPTVPIAISGDGNQNPLGE